MTDAPSSPAEVREALGRRDLKTAAAAIERQLDQNPTDVEWLMLHADLTGARGRIADALTETRAVRYRFPENRLARMKEAQWLARLGRLKSAQLIYELLLAEAPTPEIRTLLGLIHLWHGDWHTAGTFFDEALRELPDDPLAFVSRLRVLIATGQPSRAWTRAQQQDLRTGQSDDELGLLLAGIAIGVDASDPVQVLTSRPPSSAERAGRATGLRALSAGRMGHLEQATNELRTLIEGPAPDYDAFIEAANGYGALDQQSLARAAYLRAEQLTPERPEARLGLARLASREGRLSGSLADYQRITADNPESFEGWLGQIQMAQLLGETRLAQEALHKAWEIAPHSALLHQEQLRLALHHADIDAFKDALRLYLRDQPEDRTAQVLDARMRSAEGESGVANELLAAFDPLAPQLGSQILRLALHASANSPSALEGLPVVPADELKAAANGKLAEQLAFLAEPGAAHEIARRAGPDSAAWTDCLARGWWAFLSAPIATSAQLAPAFDSQARVVWLASQIQNRLRTLAIQTGSSLEDEWLLARAVWFRHWSNRWDSSAAALDLNRQIVGLVSGWNRGVGGRDIEEAYRASEQPLDPAIATLSRQITQAHWRQYRFDFATALQNFQRLARVYPDSTEPVYAQTQILQASGRWSEAARLLHRLTAVDSPPPLVRLQYCEILRRLGRGNEARQQLEELAAEGFDEPELYARQAGLARREGLDAKAEECLLEGLRKFPDASELLRLRAERWMEHKRSRELARLLTGNPSEAWSNPDILAAAWADLEPGPRRTILESPAWWFNWQWLPWERLAARSLAQLERQSQQAALAGDPTAALEQLTPALDARIPDSELWLRAARWYDFTGDNDQSAQAYRFAEQLGLGRPDAAIARLTQESRRRPLAAAREFAERLEIQPDDPALQKGLVTALLRGGEVNAAARALAPLVSEASEDIEVQMLAAEVKSAQGRIREGRSLYHSILRDDPLAADARAGRIALADVSEWGIAAGFEYDSLRDTSASGAGLSDWREAFLSTYWRRRFRQTWTLEYRWFDRYQAEAHQLGLDWTRVLDTDWILRLNAAGADDEDIIAKWRLGGGVSHKLTETLWAGIDGRFLDYSDVNVWQFIPSLTWRWHPRGTVEGRIYVSDNQFETGEGETSLTWLVQSSWEFNRSALVTLYYAQGDEDSLNPIPGLIANDHYRSAGVRLKLNGNRSWQLQPAYRYEEHRNFDLHGIALTVSHQF